MSTCVLVSSVTLPLAKFKLFCISDQPLYALNIKFCAERLKSVSVVPVGENSDETFPSFNSQIVCLDARIQQLLVVKTSVGQSVISGKERVPVTVSSTATSSPVAIVLCFCGIFRSQSVSFQTTRGRLSNAVCVMLYSNPISIFVPLLFGIVNTALN